MRLAVSISAFVILFVGMPSAKATDWGSHKSGKTESWKGDWKNEDCEDPIPASTQSQEDCWKDWDWEEMCSKKSNFKDMYTKVSRWQGKDCVEDRQWNDCYENDNNGQPCEKDTWQWDDCYENDNNSSYCEKDTWQWNDCYENDNNSQPCEKEQRKWNDCYENDNNSTFCEKEKRRWDDCYENDNNSEVCVDQEWNDCYENDNNSEPCDQQPWEWEDCYENDNNSTYCEKDQWDDCYENDNNSEPCVDQEWQECDEKYSSSKRWSKGGSRKKSWVPKYSRKKGIDCEWDWEWDCDNEPNAVDAAAITQTDDSAVEESVEDVPVVVEQEVAESVVEAPAAVALAAVEQKAAFSIVEEPVPVVSTIDEQKLISQIVEAVLEVQEPVAAIVEETIEPVDYAAELPVSSMITEEIPEVVEIAKVVPVSSPVISVSPTLTISAIPEPTTALLALFGLGIVSLRRGKDRL